LPQKYVSDIVVPCMVDTVILSRGLQGTIVSDEVERELRALSGFEFGEHTVRSRLETLERTGHVRSQGNGYVLTDDGRSDINKALPWFQKVAQRTLKPGAPGMR
jgi:repressor of nif and glnA expression